MIILMPRHIARVYAHEVTMGSACRDHETMRVKCRRRNRLAAISEEARVRFPLADRSSRVDVEDFHLVTLGAHCKYGRMLVYAERLEVVARRLDCLDALIHTDVPEFYFAVTTTGDELALTSTLQMDVRDPLLVLLPDLDHGCCRFLALVVNADGAIAKACDENVAFDLVGGE